MKQLKTLIWPATTVLLLVGVLIYQQNLYARAYVDESYFKEIASVIRELPMSHGADWIGTPSEVPKAARELLNANEALSISFRNLTTDESVELVIVHCADARDIVGHYPPVCYPAHGWKAKSKEKVVLSGQALAEPGNGQEQAKPSPIAELPCTFYRFERIDEGYSHVMSILNYMVLPDGRIGPSMEIVNQAASDLTKRGRGVMQVQILFRDQMMPDKRRQEIADEFLAYLQPVLKAVWKAEGQI